ncbi:MAG: ADP-ribosylglycohydrolase family protein [Caldilineaceae bacterium]|nr:ADP-ribosylglycohydrolase family protein [Caldilineaceae bacterium]
MSLPADYLERVYAGVLGKIIGVYLGRPFEGWTYETIMERLGEVNYYVHEKRNVPLIVTDDDISGTFTFLRALEDYGYSRDLTPAQIGQTWLNYLIEERTVLWWGGMGNSTEHTAYLRLKHGVQAPASGSIASNGKVVAEQIGAQIFIDGWAMVAPGDPELAADLARRAGSVSHDGEAIYGAQVLAAMEALAFVESDLNVLIDTALTFIPGDSVIHRLIGDIREWHAAEPDWRKTREQIAATYGYDKYGGNCHMVPNHALIIHALLHGEDDFQKSLMIVNTSGWDTDCNSGNVGCLLGIKNGLAGIDHGGPDWRTPVADRMYLPTADGGRAVSDAVTETLHVVNAGRALAGQPPVAPKDGARYHFELPGSVQGFMPEDSVEVRGVVTVENVTGHSAAGARSLALRYAGVAPGRSARVATPTFVPSKEISEYFSKRGYALLASPKLYPGQTVAAALSADAANATPVECCLYVRVYGEGDVLTVVRGPRQALAPGASVALTWTIPDTGGAPIADVGVELASDQRADGTAYLDFLTWSGTPDVVLTRPDFVGAPQRRFADGLTSDMWRRAWVNGMDSFDWWWPENYRIIQNEGRGLLIQGTRDWTDYVAAADVAPHMAKAAGLAVRVQGMRRYYALLLCDDQKVRLIKALDGDTVLAEQDFAWRFGGTYDLELAVEGNRLRGKVNGELLFDVEDTDRPLTGGAVALVCEVGRTATNAVSVRPVAA